MKSVLLLIINLSILLIADGFGSKEGSGGRPGMGRKLRESYDQLHKKALNYGHQLNAKYNGGSGELGAAFKGARARGDTLGAKLGAKLKPRSKAAPMTPNGGKGAETEKERPEGDSGAMVDIDSKLKSGNPYLPDADNIEEAIEKDDEPSPASKGNIAYMIAQDVAKSGGKSPGNSEYDSQGRRRSYHQKLRESKGLEMDQDDDDFDEGYDGEGSNGEGSDRRSYNDFDRYGPRPEYSRPSRPQYDHGQWAERRGNARRGYSDFDDDQLDEPEYSRPIRPQYNRAKPPPYHGYGRDKGIRSFSTLEGNNQDNAVPELNLAPVEFSSISRKDLDEDSKNDSVVNSTSGAKDIPKDSRPNREYKRQTRPQLNLPKRPVSRAFDKDEFNEFRKGGRAKARGGFPDFVGGRPNPDYSRPIRPGSQTDHAERPKSRSAYGRADYNEDSEDDSEHLRPSRRGPQYPRGNPRSPRRSGPGRLQYSRRGRIGDHGIQSYSTLENSNDDNAVPDLPLEPVSYRSNFAKDLFTIAKPGDEQGDDHKDDGSKENLEKRAKANNVVSDDRDPRDRIESPDFHDDHAKDDKHGWSSKINSGDHKEGDKHHDEGGHHDKDGHGNHIKKEETEFPEERERKPPGNTKLDKERKPGIKSYSSLGGDDDYGEPPRGYRRGGNGGRGYGGGRRGRGRGGDRYGYNNNYRNRGRDDYGDDYPDY